MLYRLRQKDGRNNLFGNWIEPDGRSVEIASADNSMTPTVVTDIEGRKMPTGWRVAIPARGLAIETITAESEVLDGHQLSLLGRADQFCRQPRRIRISGVDGILAPT